MKRRLAAILIVFLCVAQLSVGAASAAKTDKSTFVPASIDTSKINVILNGTEIHFDVNPIILNDRTMVPFRGIMESLGLNVEWIDETKTVIAQNSKAKIVLTIGSTLAYVNDVAYTLDAAPVIIQGRTLVPVRFISESVDMDVQWNSVASVVFINSLDSFETQTYSSGKPSYVGQVDTSNDRCGFGTSYAEDGSIIYVGQWQDNEENGLGTYTWKSKITYQGECKNGEADGYGKMIFPETGNYIGYFVGGKREGIGTFTWDVGDNYIGYWDNDKMNGQGTYTFSDGYAIEGTWDQNAIKVQELSFSHEKLDIEVGDQEKIVAAFKPIIATEQIIWKTSNDRIVQVNGKGNLGTLNALATGTAVITASTSSGKVCTCQVTVKAKTITADTISLNYGDRSMQPGDRLSLSATITPSNVTDKTVSWTTSNAQVATVNSNGVVNAVSNGSAIISATTVNGRTATCYVNVTNPFSDLWSGTWSAYHSNEHGTKNSFYSTFVIDAAGKTFKSGSVSHSFVTTGDYVLSCSYSSGNYDYEYTFTHISDGSAILEINEIHRSDYLEEATTSYYLLERQEAN